MESENQDSTPPELPPRASRKLNLNEALAKTISSELNSRLSTIRTSGSTATPSRISGVQYDASAPPPMPPRRGDVKMSDENLDDYDIPEENDAPPPIPPRRGDVKMSDENLEDFDIPDVDGPPPPVPPRGADVRMSDENLEDFDIPESNAPPALPPRRDEPKEEVEDEEDDVPPPIPARNYHRIEEPEDEEQSTPAPAPAPVPIPAQNNDGASAEEIKKLEEQIEDLEQEIKDKNDVISDLKTDYNRLCNEIKLLKEDSRANEDKIKKLKAENEKLKSDNEKLKGENEKLKSDNEVLKQKNKQLKIDTERPATPTKPASPIKSANPHTPVRPATPTKPSSPTKSPTKPGPAIPPKPSRKVCESMLQTADSEEYDFSGESPKASEKQRPVKEVAEEESEKEESTSGSVEFLPGTSSRPLVLPTKSCVRKRGNRLSSAITERKTSKKVTSTLMEEPMTLDIDSPTSATTPVDVERKTSTRKSSTSSKPQTPVIPPKPQLPSRSSERKVSTGSGIGDNSELRSRLEKLNRDDTIEEDPTTPSSAVPKSPVKKPSMSHTAEPEQEHEADEEVVKSPSIKEEGDVEGGEGREEEGEKEEEPEINPTLSRIHKIGRGLPSMLPEGGLSAVKLRSRREDSHSSGGRQLERLDEDALKKWIFATTKKDEVAGDLFTILHDGQLLCELINAIRSDKQITPKKGRMRAWHIVNINAYLSGCVDLRIKTLFKAEDLYENEGLDKIIDNLSELKFYADSKK